MMYGDNELKVTVDKDQLLSTLKDNRTNHEALYKEAKAAFKEDITEELEDMLADIKAGNSVQLRFENHAPESHVSDYDDVIEMLELSVNSELEISHQQFKQWVKDEWDWVRNWTASNAAYLSTTSGGIR